MRKSILFLFLISFCFNFTACSYHDDSENENSSGIFHNEESLEETMGSEELISQITDCQDKIEVTSEHIQGNILGYSLIRTAEGISYVRDPDYLIEKAAVGKGIFVSEHMAETEAFLGMILMDVLEGRGEIAEENKKYFTDWAVWQLNETDWQLLDKEWEPDKYAYDRSYTLSYIWGDMGYEFTYNIYADRATITKAETQAVQIKLSIDCNGMICGISVDIRSVDKEHSGVIYTENIAGLFCDEYLEQVMEEGVRTTSGDAAASAEQFWELVTDVLESRGGDAAKYKELFADETSFGFFSDHKWEQLEDNWKANRFYDCYCINTIQDAESMGLLYYIYPDYGEMGAETAKAVTFRCYVDTISGKITGTKLSIISMTQEQYQAAKEYLGKRILVIRNGEVQGGGDAPIPFPEEALTPIYLKDYVFEDIAATDNLGEKYDSGIYIDDELKPYQLGKQLWKELADNGDCFGINKEGENWQLKEGYDCYYYNNNERAGSNHYRYYFYREKAEEEMEQALLIDAWVSENEIASIESRYLMVNVSQIETVPVYIEKETAEDEIASFLTFDWTADNVLWEHSLQPADSAQGWEFSIADVDFDGICEMLVTFPSNHCGQNCLYIYKQNGGEVYSFADTIAVFENHIVCKTEYKGISPYLEIKLLDAYVNENNEYKYLSLDNSSFGGDVIHGGIYTLYLYETVLEGDAGIKELVKIVENWPEKKREIYFLGEKIYELGALREQLSAYMDGYTEMEIEYKTAGETFPRDILGWSDEEKKRELEILYEALREINKWNR